MFKVGDKVICIEGISPKQHGPAKGEIYTISSINRDAFGVIFLGFPLSRFEPNWEMNFHTLQKIRSGETPNWGSVCFKDAKEIVFNNKLNSLIKD